MHPRSQNCLLAFLLILLCVAAPAAGEVMDKEPTVRQIWSATLPLTAIALAVGTLHPLLGLVILVVPNRPLGMLAEVHKPWLGPAIRAEAGPDYILHVYTANALVLLGYVVGVSLWRKRQQRRTAEGRKQFA